MVHKTGSPNRDIDDEEAALPLRHFKPRTSLKYGVTGDEETLFFLDGKRRIDFVLVYRTGGTKAVDHKREMERMNFQEQIEQQGIDFELDVRPIPGQPPEVKQCFVKLHATWELLTKYADIMKIRMPLKKELEIYREDEISRYCPSVFQVDRTLLPPLPHYVSTGFSKSKEALFNIPDKDSFFTPSQRSQIIWECLSRLQFTGSKNSHMGIQTLLSDGAFQGAFPLHDGPAKIGSGKPTNLRASLSDQWGKFSRFFKFQPISYIRNYFGERTGFYFAWMEFYTLMLIPAVIVGSICLLYGVVSSTNDTPTTELCNDKELGRTVMCPICEKRCPYWRLRDTCPFSKATYLIDNPAIICFATFMALWSSLFVILWRRKQNILSWNFDTYDVTEQEEPVRPQLEAKFKPEEWRLNPITGINEPYISPVRLFFQNLLSTGVILFMVLLVFVATFATIVYRTTLNISIYTYARKNNPDVEQGEIAAVKFSSYPVGFSAAVLNLIVILILNAVYFRIAKWLTEREYRRTQTEHDNSLITKYYIFEFVNTYTSLFYVAFFKGRFPAAVPGARIFGDVPVDRCDKAGCVIELTIQLGVLFVGSNLVNFVQEIIWPLIMRKIRDRARRNEHLSRWESDNELVPYPSMGLFLEYSRMITQFGFITMFVAAFPIASIFALINNLIEIRMNAYKYLTFFQRPVPLWAKNIGAWGKILENVARFSVITNAFIIAFTSDFVPKLTYLSAYSTDSTLSGYVNWTLSAFHTDDFPFGTEPEFPGHDEFDPLKPPEECWYPEFRMPYWDRKKYGFTMVYWNVLAARVILVLVFEHFVMVITKIISFFVPDMPQSLKLRALRENYLAKEAFFDLESRREGRLARGSTHKARIVPRTEL